MDNCRYDMEATVRRGKSNIMCEACCMKRRHSMARRIGGLIGFKCIGVNNVVIEATSSSSRPFHCFLLKREIEQRPSTQLPTSNLVGQRQVKEHCLLICVWCWRQATGDCSKDVRHYSERRDRNDASRAPYFLWKSIPAIQYNTIIIIIIITLFKRHNEQ